MSYSSFAFLGRLVFRMRATVLGPTLGVVLGVVLDVDGVLLRPADVVGVLLDDRALLLLAGLLDDLDHQRFFHRSLDRGLSVNLLASCHVVVFQNS